MEKYSWYTGKETKKSWILGYRYYSRVAPYECRYFAEHHYKPPMKGGHTHNHKQNAIMRNKGWFVKSKELRQFSRWLYKHGLCIQSDFYWINRRAKRKK